MSAVHSLLLGLSVLLGADHTHATTPAGADPARLREMLLDRQHPRNQSQAALLLVQSHAADADDIIRQGLQQTESPEVFLALADALRLCRDMRFLDELLEALASGKPAVRQAAAETLAVLANQDVVRRLQKLAESSAADVAARQAAIGTLGRIGRKPAVAVLLDQLFSDNQPLRLAAGEALADVTGQMYGSNIVRWLNWWESHKNLSDERWLEERLAYQASRARRLEGDLERTQAQVVRLHQQLYGRLPPADRLGHVQGATDHEDANIRALAVAWSVELLPGADAVGQRALADTLLRLSGDTALEVQRPAVLGLGRVQDGRVAERLQVLLRRGRPPVRAAAARALAQQAAAPVPKGAADAQVLRRQVVGALQKALDDPALEVVVEAAEDLGTLGVPEAGPVLAALLHHPSEPVRQAAAQALERVADVKVLDGLLKALDDSAVTVRFSLIGALGHAAGGGEELAEAQRSLLRARLEDLLVRDPDPGVRSRAATVLGECGAPAVLASLWQRVIATEDSRVQDKAWAAVINIVIRAGSMELLSEWDRTLKEAKQGPRRLQLLAAACDGWKKKDEGKALVGPALAALIEVQLEQGKWAAAFPRVQELLGRPGSDADRDKQLRWLLTVGEQALKEGNQAEALRSVQEAQPFLARSKLAGDFEKLQQQAQMGAQD